ncbi:MAG: glycosyltransferase family 4 protein [Micrococcales bacterium]|nr:glycosyltransferase family 4 protein [Micrococcales bacterium]
MANDNPKVLVATLDTLGERMAGPAIRAWTIASTLAEEHPVRLVTFGECTRSSDSFDVEHTDVDRFRKDVEWADVLIVQGYLGASFPWLETSDVVLVSDLYDPFHIESLEVQKDEPLKDRRWALNHAMAELSFQLLRGDMFLCASDRQRDLWIGHLAALGRVNPWTYDDDPGLGSLVKIVPFGIDPEPPSCTSGAVRGVVEGIGPDDRVLLWAGGVYNWFDPLTLVRALDVVRQQVPEVRLLFMGMSHPNQDVPTMRRAHETRQLADELGLTGRWVFFHEGWVPYEERAAFLLDADIGVSCHLPGIETEYSFRTRMLDYLWAGLPMVCTQGDTFAERVTRDDLGRTVAPGAVDELATAVVEMLREGPDEREARRDRVRRAARDFTWPTVLSPLVAVCAAPRRAADAGTRRAGHRTSASLVRAVFRVLRTSGPRGVWEKARLRLARR